MKIDVFYMNVTPLEDINTYKEALQYIDDARRERIEKTVQCKNKYLSLGAGLLYSYGVLKHLQGNPLEEQPESPIPIDVPTLLTVFKKESSFWWKSSMKNLETPSGKPYVVNLKEFYYNISHSGKLAAIAISNEEIGMDIQEYRPVKQAFFKRIINSSEVSEEIKDILTVWSAKEAFIKYTGQGLKKDLRELILSQENTLLYDTKTQEYYRIRKFEIEEKEENQFIHYALVLCTGKLTDAK